MSDEIERTSIGISIQSSSMAFPFLNALENKSGFGRVVLEDFLKVNKGNHPENYTELSEKERLEKYFYVKKSRNEIKQLVLKYVAQMKAEEKERLSYEMEYVYLLQRYGRIFIKKLYLDYYFLQFVVLNAKKLAKNGVPYQGVEYAFYLDLESFRALYADNYSDAKWVTKFVEQEQSINAAERLFALLANQWFAIMDMLPGAKALAAGQVVDYILEFMETYPDCAYMDSGFATVEFTVFLERKLKTIEKPAPTAASGCVDFDLKK